MISMRRVSLGAGYRYLIDSVAVGEGTPHRPDTLAAEYRTLAGVAQAERWDDLLARSGLTPEQLQTISDGDSHGALHTALRTAEAHHLDIEAALPHLVSGRSLEDAGDVGAVIVGRVTDPDLNEAVTERDHALRSRASTTLAEQAFAEQTPWLRHLGKPPIDPAARQRWTSAITTIAAYRDHRNITDSSHPLGGSYPARPGVTRPGTSGSPLMLFGPPSGWPRSHNALSAQQASRVSTLLN